MTVAEIIKKTMLAGIGAQEKAKEFIEELVKAGELSKSEGAALAKEWMAKAEESTKDMDVKLKDAVAAAYEKFNIPSRDELKALENKLQSISARLAKLENNGGPRGV